MLNEFTSSSTDKTPCLLHYHEPFKSGVCGDILHAGAQLIFSGMSYINHTLQFQLELYNWNYNTANYLAWQSHDFLSCSSAVFLCMRSLKGRIWKCPFQAAFNFLPEKGDESYRNGKFCTAVLRSVLSQIKNKAFFCHAFPLSVHFSIHSFPYSTTFKSHCLMNTAVSFERQSLTCPKWQHSWMCWHMQTCVYWLWLCIV